MADRISKEQRSWTMSRVRSKDTTPEMRVRSEMHRTGYRFRLHVSGMPGKPDIVLPRFRTVIFVNGCFWHRHPGCRYAATPKSNVDYWERKFETNVVRDERSHASLRQDGWTVLIIWECQTRSREALVDTLSGILPPRA